MQYYYDDKEFGRVIVTVRSNMRHYTARWKGEQLHLNIPPGLSRSDLQGVLDKMRSGIRQRKEKVPKVTFEVGQVINCFRCQVTIVEQSQYSDRMTFGRDDAQLTLGIPRGLDLTSSFAKTNISRGLQGLVEGEMRRRLFPYAEEVAAQVGASPTDWEIGRGLRKLGHCTPKGVIQLSRNLIFLPERLVRYVICHELAHLTHMNHSPQFHALVNQYTNGQEKVLEQELKHFFWPIMR